ncbi:hypothetical protein Rhopal_006503-T1 [Rhodotorula paludigena]|uniref:Uncharacterized protein n=1 Tax=Rhodotorula paludigena TaxID=86838 RepID=A0AAV5GVS9_9BASI|nr:hypothetical protein Rhopal_006503-T1 [Rhodotorula paludigena]
MEYDGQWSPTSTKNGSPEEEDERDKGEVDEAAWDDDKVRAQARDALEMSVEEYEDKWGRGAARDGNSPPALTSTLRFGRPRVKDLPDWKHAHLPPGPPVAFTLHARIFPPAAPRIVRSKRYCDAARASSPPRSPHEPATQDERPYHPSARLSSFRFMRPKPAATAAARFTCGLSGDAVIELSPSPSPTPPPMPVEEQIWLERECERDNGMELEEGEVLMQDVTTLVDSEDTPLSLRGGAASLTSATTSQSSNRGQAPSKPTAIALRGIPAGTSNADGDIDSPMLDDASPASPTSPSSRPPFTRSASVPPRSSTPPPARGGSPAPQAQHRATHRVHPTRERSPYAYEGEHDEDPWAEREREIQQEEDREVAEVLRRKRRNAEVAVGRGEVEVLDLTGDESDEE